MAHRDIVVIGASAGGVEALTQIAQQLPAEFPAALFIVLHVSPYGFSQLPYILSRKGSLRALHPDDGEEIQPGRIYVAPPDNHLLLRRGRIRLSRGPRENGHRPAVDTLFCSAANAYGRRTIGVILSGTLDDGTAGLLAVKQRGGIAVVQDPEDSIHAGMPRNSIKHVQVDHILPLNMIVPALVNLTGEPLDEKEIDVDREIEQQMELEAEIAEFDREALHAHTRRSTTSGFTCPECHGSLYEIQEGELVRFRCRVGHAYSEDSLIADQAESLEAAMWTALRALEERAALARSLARRSQQQSRNISARNFEEMAAEAERRADVIRQVLLKDSGMELPEEGAIAQQESHGASSGAG